MFWALRTGSPWRDLPSDYGGWKSTHRRFCRWRGKEGLGGPARRPRRRPRLRVADGRRGPLRGGPSRRDGRDGRRAGRRARKRGGATPRPILPWTRLVCRFDSLSRRVQSRIALLLEKLMEGLRCGFPLADRGHGAEAVVSPAEAMGAGSVMPPRSSRRVRRPYDRHIYKQGTSSRMPSCTSGVGGESPRATRSAWIPSSQLSRPGVFRYPGFISHDDTTYLGARGIHLLIQLASFFFIRTQFSSDSTSWHS